MSFWRIKLISIQKPIKTILKCLYFKSRIIKLTMCSEIGVIGLNSYLLTYALHKFEVALQFFSN